MPKWNEAGCEFETENSTACTVQLIITYFSITVSLQVQYGSEHVVEWGVGRDYDDVMISSGTSLLFKWSSDTRHNVVELRSIPSMDVCDFTSSESGQVRQHTERKNSITSHSIL